MNAGNLTALGLASILSLGSITAVSLMPSPAYAEASTLKQGKFKNDAKRVSGVAKIIKKANGKRVLQLDKDFQSGRGPDVFILLHQQAKPTQYRNNYTAVGGPLKTFSGTKEFEIPAEVNLAEVKSVVVWCREFNVTFGYAPLGN